MPLSDQPELRKNQLKNLNREGAKPRYGVSKKQRNISVSQEGWEGFHDLAKSQGLSLSELIEHLGRGEFKIIPISQDDVIA